MFQPVSQVTIETLHTAPIGTIFRCPDNIWPLFIVGKIDHHKAICLLEPRGEYRAFEVHSIDQVPHLTGICVTPHRYEIDPSSGVLTTEEAKPGFLVRSANALGIFCRQPRDRLLLQVADLEIEQGCGIKGYFGSWRAVTGDLANPRTVFQRS